MNQPVAVITGATSGIGEIGAQAIAAAGYEVLLLCRNPDKGEATRARIQQTVPEAVIRVIECPMDSLAAVHDCAVQIARDYPRIELLVNNAGTAEMSYSRTVDGIERTFAVNHLAHFVLTWHLLPSLKAAGAESGARIIHTASEAHYQADRDFLDDINWERRRYFVFKAYCDSKLANVLFSEKLARELEDTGVVSNCFHPGRVATNIWPDRRWYERLLFGLLKKVYLISPEQGARPMIHLALDPAMAKRSGVFLFEMQEKDIKSFASDPALQDALWEKSLVLAADYLA